MKEGIFKAISFFDSYLTYLGSVLQEKMYDYGTQYLPLSKCRSKKKMVCLFPLYAPPSTHFPNITKQIEDF